MNLIKTFVDFMGTHVDTITLILVTGFIFYTAYTVDKINKIGTKAEKAASQKAAVGTFQFMLFIGSFLGALGLFIQVLNLGLVHTSIGVLPSGLGTEGLKISIVGLCVVYLVANSFYLKDPSNQKSILAAWFGPASTAKNK